MKKLLFDKVYKDLLKIEGNFNENNRDRSTVHKILTSINHGKGRFQKKIV